METSHSYLHEAARKVGEAQHVGNTNPTEGEHFSHENRKQAEKGSNDGAGPQILFGTESRDTQRAEGDFNNGLGFSFHTPSKNSAHYGLSSQIKKGDSTTTWQVYSRNRRYLKKPQAGCSNTEDTDTAREINTRNPQQKQILDRDQGGTGFNDNNVSLVGTTP